MFIRFFVLKRQYSQWLALLAGLFIFKYSHCQIREYKNQGVIECLSSFSYSLGLYYVTLHMQPTNKRSNRCQYLFNSSHLYLLLMRNFWYYILFLNMDQIDKLCYLRTGDVWRRFDCFESVRPIFLGMYDSTFKIWRDEE